MAQLEFSIPSTIPEPFSPNYLFAKDEIPEFLIPKLVHSFVNTKSANSLTTSRLDTYATLTNFTEESGSVTLDYGVAVAGIPVLHIHGLDTPSNKALIDFTVSEGYPGITKSEGDGPYPFSAGADTSRRVRFRVSGPGFYEAKCVQGSQRWLKVSLITKSPCSVSEDMGVLVDSQRCNAYGWGHLWTDYNLEFDGMILEGGLAWMVRVSPGMPGMLFQLNVENGKAVIEQWFGYYNKPQTTLVPKLIASVEIPEPKISEGEWLRIRTSCIGEAPVSISIDNTQVATFKQGGLKVDDALVKFCWDKLKSCIAYVSARVNKDGLVCAEGFDGGDYDYYNGLQTGISTKRNALFIASLKACAHIAFCPGISDKAAAEAYAMSAISMVDAVRKHCFNANSGHYNITDTRTEGFQQEMHAWLILKHICKEEQMPSLLDKFGSLVLPSTINEAPLSFSPDTPGPPPVISPIMSAFHIQAALQAGRPAEGERVLRSVFGPMADKSSEHFTGTTWEFLNPDGTPFKGDFCSYAQLFGAGPTSIPSQYALGVEPLAPGFKEFRIWPRFDVNGLKWAQGRVPTPVGDGIVVKWQVFKAGWLLEAWAPLGLDGKVRIPSQVWERKQSISVDGKQAGVELEVPFTKHIKVAVTFR
ncbi:hypothetical protein COL154_012298 [Colletotrichum chrysophilum]|nr:hypothetical protein COL154_012298 [Colletotrichum chrysophilum]